MSGADARKSTAGYTFGCWFCLVAALASFYNMGRYGTASSLGAWFVVVILVVLGLSLGAISVRRKRENAADSSGREE